MSEEQLDRALQAMNDEQVDRSVLEAARSRVWAKVSPEGATTCAEFRQDFPAYLTNELTGSRRLLVEDHLGRCPSCRARLAALKAEMRGESKVVAMTPRSSFRVGRWASLAAAAAIVLAVTYMSRDAIDGMMAPSGPRATVVSAQGGVYRVTAGSLEAGAGIGEGEAVRTGPGSRAVLRLADGSTVEVNERSELYLAAAWSGLSIHLQRGDVIVQAAKQRRGRLRVLTRDSIASVKGTVFAVSAGMGGSVVSVVEGSVAVDQPGKAVLLRPGQQAASKAALASSVASAVSWSPDRDQYLALLASFVQIDRELATFPVEMRTTSELLPYLPSAAVVYGAVPNPGLTIGRALSLAEEQAGQNAAFGAWWNSDAGRLLKQITDRIQSVNPLLGDEIGFSVSVLGADRTVPMVMARVRPGKRAELVNALQGLFVDVGEAAAPYSVSDEIMIVSDSSAHLSWAAAQLRQGAGSAFAAAIAERYRRGVSWLVAVDAPVLVKAAAHDDAPPVELAGMMGMKYLFLEQRAPAGAEENEVTAAFQGARTGIGSWLADSGSGGAAEYLPADALAAGYVSTREPLQIFEELTALVTKADPNVERDMAEIDQQLGAGFIQNLTAALGTESALAVTGFSTSGPTWVLASLANNPLVIDSSLKTLVDAFNAQLGPDLQANRVTLTQESISGRTWSTLKPGRLPIAITWTYDRGYLVAASDRGVAERAIATRNGGTPLVWSPDFLGQLPSSAGLHPSAFGWLNPKGVGGLLSGLAPNPALAELLSNRDPILVVFDGTPEQIHAASRTRITGLLLDVMLMENLGQAIGQQARTSEAPR